MIRTLRHSRFVWLVVGLVGGLMVGGFWPHTPLHAVSTDRAETFAIATGTVDQEVEAIFFLDFLTGDLRGAVLGVQNGKFSAFYEYNVTGDLGVEGGKTPHYVLVTGMADFRRTSGRARLGNTVVYVAETSSGKVAAYAVPWDRGMYTANRMYKGSFLPLDKFAFRTAAVRPAAQ